ncbi:MAG: four helix bundle protein [Saprospiraceae bacterium]|nr:four helix bundle protein [Saprospiraceae bacterium]
MENIKYYGNLFVWQKGMDLCKRVYLLTRLLPKDELYGLTSQLRRASVSVVANIAEGHSRNSKNQYKYFLGIASGSLAELETLVLLSHSLGFTEEKDIDDILNLSKEVGKMLNTIMKKLVQEH